jgi:hypothetical protein
LEEFFYVDDLLRFVLSLSSELITGDDFWNKLSKKLKIIQITLKRRRPMPVTSARCIMKLDIYDK